MVTRSENCPRKDVCLREGKGTVNIKDLATAEDLYNHGRLFAQISIEPGHSIGFHDHQRESELFYVIKGEGVYNDNGKEVTVGVGDVCICPSGESHCIENKGSELLQLVALIVME